ncbi:MAG TPA: DUF445 domain-containing protein [Gemmatimonadales bacterium]
MTGVGAPPPLPRSAPSPLTDAVRRVELARMKRIATGLLVAALVTLVIARIYEPLYPWLGYIRATAEAAVVGGLADWFAVTALFRRPLGLPIPHTAIIPSQKDRIGQILGNFVQNHFINREVLSAKLHEMKLGTRLGVWLRDEENAARLARGLAGGLAKAVEVLPEEEVRQLVHKSAVDRLQKIQLAPVLADVLSLLATDERRHLLLDGATSFLAEAVEEGKGTIREKIHEQRPWWVPPVVEEPLTRRVVAAMRKVAEEIRHDSSHPVRLKFDAALADFIARLKDSPEVIARAESIKQDMLGHPAMQGFAASLWDQARGAARRYATEPDQVSLVPLEQAIMAVGDSLLAREAIRVDLERFLTNMVATLLDQQRHEVAELIASTVRKWDPDMASTRIELAVGRDLQFIRLNGTLVGGLAGLVIYVVVRMFE